MYEDNLKQYDQLIQQMKQEENERGLIKMIRAEVINHNNGKKQGFRSGSVSPYQFVWASDFINEVENNPLHRSEYIIYEAIKREKNDKVKIKMISALERIDSEAAMKFWKKM